ncbi:FAD-dependent oxidoreductase [Amaricoccus sp.]|uniref:FAD-dependent oxidoreductase n=1 Tax=Amaricoccus sp. TaxID=1872485 RepID=UPI001B4F7910|nr:FAD-dependent oxidoreductase [Amaricoccus sp.]MBP7001517.1 FAD-dependent oxidoreductase [Amaricoccus sp.]
MAAADGLGGIAEGATFDLAVLGAGAGGMAAAVFAALEGQRVLLVERTEYLGGTSALSAATTWIPGTRLAATVGAEDSRADVSGFLDRAVGNRAPKALREAFLDAGPDAIHTLLDRTDAQFRARPFHPDYLYELEGATACGRALEPEPFDGRALGADLALVRPPIPEFTILGGMAIDRDDIKHLLRMKQSAASLAYALRLIARYGLARLRYPRDPRMLMGNALIGRLLLTARRLGVTILTEAEVTDLTTADGAVTGLAVRQGAVARHIGVTRGVVLASGGFTRHPTRRQQMLPAPAPDWSPAAPGHTGALHDIVLKLGAHYGTGQAQNAFWAPISVRKRKDGSMAAFPHFVLDRSKPGTVCVGKDGRRFVNESRSYHEFVAAMYAANTDGSTIPAFILCDSVALRKYGLGMVRPGGGDVKPFLADGYLVEAPTLAALAGKLGIDPAGLAETAQRMNAFAAAGVDADFHRGETVYERANGDAEAGTKNPTLGPIGAAPFYAVRLWPGDIGAAMGLVTDPDARVLREDGSPIPGVYAVGNDAQSIMGGVYPGPGITIGPAITFGYIAARHANRRAAA